MSNSDKVFEFIPIGKVTRPHGVKGELRIYLYNPCSITLFQVDHIWIKVEDHFVKYKIESVRSHKNLLLLKLAKINDRTSAEEFRNKELYLKRKEFPPLKENEFYIIDIIGSKVFDEQLNYYGILKEIYDTPLYTVGVIHGKGYEIDIPLLPEYIMDFSLSEKRLIIRDLDEFPICKTKGEKKRK